MFDGLNKTFTHFEERDISDNLAFCGNVSGVWDTQGILTTGSYPLNTMPVLEGPKYAIDQRTCHALTFALSLRLHKLLGRKCCTPTLIIALPA